MSFTITRFTTPLISSVVLATCCGPVHAQSTSGNAHVRAGVYADGDHTTVARLIASGRADFGRFALSLDESIDIVSSASTDVRTSPALDVISSASVGRPEMNDERFATSASLSYDDDGGHTAALSPFFATENDYQSLGASAQGTCELWQRNTTARAHRFARHDHERA
jgi:hypothetical protein